MTAVVALTVSIAVILACKKSGKMTGWRAVGFHWSQFSIVRRRSFSHQPPSHSIRITVAQTYNMMGRFFSTRKTPKSLENVRQEWSSRFEMSPPQFVSDDGTRMYLSINDVERRMRRDGRDIAKYLYNKKVCLSPEELNDQMIVYYLYAREFARRARRQDRVAHVNKFIQDADTRVRMLHVMSIYKDSKADEKEALWAYSQMVVLLYNGKDGATTIFSNRRMVFVCRLQPSLNCYLHAVSTLVGYKVSFGKVDGHYKAESFDVEKHLRHNISNDDLEKRVVNNRGGNSKDFLETIVGRSAIAPIKLLEWNAHFLAEHLLILGPALISSFKADQFFKNGRKPNAVGKYHIVQFDIVDAKEIANEIADAASDEIECFVDRELVRSYFKVTGDTVETLKFCSLGKPTEQNSLDLHEICEAREVIEGRKLSFPDDQCEIGEAQEVGEGQKLVGGDAFPDDLLHTNTSSMSSEGEEKAEDFNHRSHAMVLIGYRKEQRTNDRDKIWFLVQNTWDGLQLIEMSAAYLYKHIDQETGGISFINEHLPELPNRVHRCPHHVIKSLL
jgi:hypothetical protein